MKLRSPWLIRTIGLLGALLIRVWTGTLRYRIAILDGSVHPADPAVGRFIYAFWHESILFAAAYRAKIHVLTSLHADGELMTQVCRHLRIGVVRGSSTRGGEQALADLLQCSRRSHLALTPDGPRGPRRQVKAGVIFLASRTGLPIVPFGVAFGRAWRANSWDHFAVPLPGSIAACVVAPAVHVPARLTRQGLEYYRRLIEEQMQAATAAAEQWLAGGPRPQRLPRPGCPKASA